MRLVWDQSSQRPYETGIDRGVLYPESGPGVVWNGLQSVEETFDGGELNSYHFDSIKYEDRVSSKHFKAVITAYDAPDEFGPCIGDLQDDVYGLIITRQLRVRFGFSYRTLIGDSDYKIHIIYNALASPNNIDYSTIASSVEPADLSWSIDALPVVSGDYVPTAHYILDSTKIRPQALDDIETVLYGSTTIEPSLPSIALLMYLLIPRGSSTAETVFIGSAYGLVPDRTPLIIVPNETTGVALLQAGDGDITTTYYVGIYQPWWVGNSRLIETVIAGIYTLE